MKIESSILMMWVPTDTNTEKNKGRKNIMNKDILQELKEMKIWALYGKGSTEEKINKCPYSIKGKITGSDEKYKDTWVTYAEAVASVKKNQCMGVGFMIPKGYFFLDIDHQELDSPLVQDIMNMYDSYTEYSVTGTGIHIYGKCDVDRIPQSLDEAKEKYRLHIDYYTKNSGKGIELYVGGLTNRFTVFTGNCINRQVLNDCTDAILEMLEKYMKKDEKSGMNRKVETKEAVKQNMENNSLDVMADKVIIELLSQKNVDKFRKLYLDGDISDYHSESEADEALCGIIAYRTDDVELIDVVFRKSRLYRDKWNRKDYRDKTIRNAIERKQKKIRKARPPFIMVEIKGSEEKPVEVETVSATRLARYIRDNVDYIMVKDNANQETMTYVYQNGYYQLHDDNMLKGLIRKQIADYNEDLVQMKTVKEVVENLKAETSYVHRSNLNSEEKIINFQNGILRVTEDSLVLEQHTPDIYSTIQIPSNWTGEAKPTPIFDDYIKTLTNDNREVQQLLMEFMGVCISNVKGWRMKKSLFLVGEGDSGKSLLKSLAERLLGLDNFISTDLKDIESRFGTSAVYGKRLAGSSDMSFLSVDELKAFKRLTGGDSVFTEYKGKQGFQQTYNGVLWFCMNQLPRFGGDNGKWVYERIMVVNCPNTIPLDKQDKELLEKMYAEREGIIYKAVKALQTVLKNGYRYSEPKSVIDARSEYHNTNSTVITFFQECMCRFDSDNVFDDKYKSGIVYKVYREWCKDNNNGYAKTEKEFRDELSKYLGTKYDGITKRVRGYTYYKDYGITKDVKRMYENKVL